MSFENVGGAIEFAIEQVGWADKLTDPQRTVFVLALRGFLDMAAVERWSGRQRAWSRMRRSAPGSPIWDGA